MIAFITHNLAPLMFAGLIIFMIIGYPAAFSLAAVGLFFGLVGIELGLIAPDFLGNLTYQLFSVLSNELLLAIPFFTFMGVILEKCGLAEDLLDGFGQLFGGVRGGLSYAVILVGAVLGAITGTVAASVIAMGLISLPVMQRYGYNMRHATGVIAASGTITQLIPPSLVLIVLADQLQRSPGDMYIGATGASIVQVLLFAGWVFILSIIRPEDVPALPPEARTLRGWPLIAKCARGMIPSLALIFIVLGTIFMGLATPTEAGAMGVVGAMLLAWFNGRLTWALIYSGMDSTMRLTAMVVWILLGARVFSLVFQGVGGGHWIEEMLTSLPGGVVGFLIFVNIFVFVLAFFLDFFEIAFIVIPLLAPVAESLGINLIWFGVMICANMQTSFMHPPFGFALFYLRGIVPRSQVPTRDIYLGAIPWLVLQLILVGLLIAFPGMVTFFLDAPTNVDLNSIQITLPPGGETGGGLSAPPAFDLNTPPDFGGGPAPQPAQPQAPNLSQPPSFD
ncbi:TRAP transporter large permease subunit [Mesorhizobium sp. RP14(2022)]|uniref:TRAP transporter large permease protein n=1 Tax=Mesorhizobium liriopis TaxID=2953882 RepID=A0ABT1C4N8_9HYPH|nr:TRAP transporter large permease subunit [Mesorhizobium liriopis]MCO6049747.1 TRAP transporter large permease subunit [Mesorhizobium liriopis]